MQMAILCTSTGVELSSGRLLCRGIIIIISLHYSRCYMQPIATDGVAWSVCMSVCLFGHVHGPSKHGRTIEMLIEGKLGLAQETM